LVAPPPRVDGVGAWDAKRSRKRKFLAVAAAALVLVAALSGYLAWRPADNSGSGDEGRSNAQEQAQEGRPPTAEELAALSNPLDGRKREQIPAALLAHAGGGKPAGAPAELVAILGSPASAPAPFHLPDNATGGCIPRAYSPDGKLLVTVG